MLPKAIGVWQQNLCNFACYIVFGQLLPVAYDHPECSQSRQILEAWHWFASIVRGRVTTMNETCRLHVVSRGVAVQTTPLYWSPKSLCSSPSQTCIVTNVVRYPPPPPRPAEWPNPHPSRALAKRALLLPVACMISLQTLVCVHISCMYCFRSICCIIVILRMYSTDVCKSHADFFLTLLYRVQYSVMT